MKMCIFDSSFSKSDPKGPINNMKILVYIIVGAEQATNHYLNIIS